MKLEESHIRLLRSFRQYQVEYMLVGGHAAIYYGVERTTSDIDILIKPGTENGIKILAAFSSLALNTDDLLPEDFNQNLVLTFGMMPEAVDLMNYIVGVDIETAFEKATIFSVEDIQIKVIDIRDLLQNKLALNRTGVKGLTDQQDILVLKKIISS
ncbi:MAG TPA: hypothetical protein PK509_16640 [Catalimonadaceae bacterium]|nr:hypothetical protein [Catalimonadaceae bacterium]